MSSMSKLLAAIFCALAVLGKADPKLAVDLDAGTEDASAEAPKLEGKMAEMTPEELEENRRSFEELQALEKKRKELQEQVKLMEAENERVSQEKKRLQNQADGVVEVDDEE